MVPCGVKIAQVVSYRDVCLVDPAWPQCSVQESRTMHGTKSDQGEPTGRQAVLHDLRTLRYRLHMGFASIAKRVSKVDIDLCVL